MKRQEILNDLERDNGGKKGNDQGICIKGTGHMDKDNSGED